MLEEFRVDNFLSWINLSFRPKEENLLIGLNNTGKTNLCKALQFLSWTVRSPVDECAQNVGIPNSQITNFSYKKSTIDFLVRASLPFKGEEAKYEYSLTLSVPSSPVPDATISVETEKLTVSAEGFDDVTLLENTPDGVRLLHETGYLQRRSDQNYVDTFAPRDTTMLHRLYDLKTNERANLFKNYLGYWQYYALSQTALRGSMYKPNDFWLSPDGSNLASVIHRLKKTDEESYRKLLDCLQLVEPDLNFINFIGGDKEPSVFMYFAYKSGDNLSAWTASSGTLRFLGLVYILLAQPQLPYPFRPIVIIEEPENGLYVGLLKQILEMVSESIQTPQLIFTSHSPYFIDLFDDKLESIFVCKRDEHHSTVSRIDVEKAKKRLADYPLGHQHFREMLV